MNFYKSILIASFTGLLISGCATNKINVANLKPIEATFVPLKNGKISENELLRWSHLDIEKDTIPGMSIDRAYAELLKNKKGKIVTVAVIDSGSDIEHEDLQGMIWTNTKEIPNNNIDDDQNGYIDDVHGWNFLGDAIHENLELTRILKKGDDGSKNYQKAKQVYDEKLEEANQGKLQVDMILNADKTVSDYLKKKDYTIKDVKSILTTDAAVGNAKLFMVQILSQTTKEEFDIEINDYKDYVYDQLNYNLNLEFNGREKVGDNPNDINDIKYGNNIVYGPNKEKALHGTHVAGIIAQKRGNNLGGDGVTNNVEIMAIRAVPDGDEYDKDIALAIRYAVDNGAKVINGSFGKSFSPNKQWVYDAIKYAANKDVLFVHAAGNDADNIDVEENYPNDEEDGIEIADNMITVGALNFDYGSKMVADFSNYGKRNVDVFAPGVNIYATIPNNKYKFEQGTSMASPNVAGVAAMIRSYYPDLSASQVKKILMESGVTITKTVFVGEDSSNKMSFSDLSTSGKIVNAYNAILMAEKMSKK